MRHLEWERDKLIEETETILKRADTDNIDLRNTIKRKEDELNIVNQELNKLRYYTCLCSSYMILLRFESKVFSSTYIIL